MPSHHPLWKEAVPVLVIVTLCLWPTAFFVSSSLAFAVWGGPNNNRSSASSTFRTGQLRTGSLRGSPRGSPRRWSAGNGFFGGASNGAGGVGSVSGVGVGSARGQSPLAAVPVAAAKEAAPAEAPRTPPAASEGVQSSAAAPERSPSPPTSKAAASSSAGELGPSSAAAAEQLQLQQQRGRSAPSLSSPSGEAGNCGASGAAAAHERELALLRADLGDGVEVHQLERGRTVGLGSFGKVVLVRHAGTGTPFALKCLNRRLIVANGQQKAVQRERAIAGALSHPFCCRLIRTFKDAHAVYLLLEWCSGGELLRRLPEKGMPEAAARFYGGCTALALEHLHCKGIVYRDLKPENLLLDSRGYVKLCDFGFAKRLGASGVTHTVCGTPDFMAPEVIRSEGHGRPADLWSLGVLLYELVTGRPPFSPRGTAPQGVYAAVLAGVMAPAEGASGEFLELLRGLLQADAAKRFGWEQVKGSAWNAELDWSKLERCVRCLCCLVGVVSFRFGCMMRSRAQARGLSAPHARGTLPSLKRGFPSPSPRARRRDVQPPVIPDLSHPCDTRYFAQYPENAVALNDSRENDDDEGGMGDGEGSGEFDDDRFGDGGGACAQEVELYGSWDNCF